MFAPFRLTLQLNYLNKKVIRNRLKSKENKKSLVLGRGIFELVKCEKLNVRI